MSSLIFFTDNDQALIATDTLATLDDGRPCNFTTKAFAIPHLRMVIAGTGVGGIVGQWFVRINDRLVALGIDWLDVCTPGYLNTTWDAFKMAKLVVPKSTLTVFHFGFSENTGQCVPSLTTLATVSSLGKFLVGSCTRSPIARN